MFTQDLDAAASYRTLARGSGCGWARTYQASQRDRAGHREPMLDERVDFGMKNPKHQHPQMFTPRVRSDFGGGD